MSKNYKEIFEKIESSLRSSMNLSEEEFKARFEGDKTLTFSEKSDSFYFDDLKFITFYSGFKAKTVTDKTDVINKHFPDIETVAKYGEDDIKKILADEEMIKHPGKIESVIKNAKICQELIKEYGSVHNYLVSLEPEKDLHKFYLIAKDKFAHLGEITTFHFMMEIGLNVVKPDLVVTRIFERLGLIDNPKDLWNTVNVASKFVEATWHPFRYIDIVFVIYGQQSEVGICIDKPKCSLCGVYDICKYENKRR